VLTIQHTPRPGPAVTRSSTASPRRAGDRSPGSALPSRRRSRCSAQRTSTSAAAASSTSRCEVDRGRRAGRGLFADPRRREREAPARSLANVDADFEVFFRLSGPAESRVRVALRHPVRGARSSPAWSRSSSRSRRLGPAPVAVARRRRAAAVLGAEPAPPAPRSRLRRPPAQWLQMPSPTPRAPPCSSTCSSTAW
jgi:hypothetical protein